MQELCESRKEKKSEVAEDTAWQGLRNSTLLIL